MWKSDPAADEGTEVSIGGEGTYRHYCVAAVVNDDLIAAAEGWRRAHGFAELPEALGELVRLGLMSEVAKIYRLVCRDGNGVDSDGDVFRKSRRPHRSRRGERKVHHLPTI